MAESEVDLQALGIADDEPYDQGDASGELPQQIGLWFPAPQPGNAYSFFIPGPMIWLPEQVMENNIPANRPRLYFRSVKDKPASKGANPLEIIASPKDEFNGNPFPCTISTTRRARNKEKTVFVSDAAYLMRALKPDYVLGKLSQLVLDLTAAGPGAVFDGTVEWNGQCNPKMSIYSAVKEEVIEGRMGCGMKYALRRRKDNNPKATFPHFEGIPKDGVKYLDRFKCFNPKCEAQVRMFAQLGNFRAGTVTVEEA